MYHPTDPDGPDGLVWTLFRTVLIPKSSIIQSIWDTKLKSSTSIKNCKMVQMTFGLLQEIMRSLLVLNSNSLKAFLEFKNKWKTIWKAPTKLEALCKRHKSTKILHGLFKRSSIRCNTICHKWTLLFRTLRMRVVLHHRSI